MILPEQFKEMISKLAGVDSNAFFKALEEPPVVSIKRNIRKPESTVNFQDPDGENISATPVGWCLSGLYLENRPDFTLDPLMHAGIYYVQDASSMIYETIIREIIHSELTNSAAPLTVADLCASPGGKSTSMLNALPDGSLLLSNEYDSRRASVLAENMSKWGYPHTIVTNSDVAKLADVLPGGFDIVAVDAPCSGEGMMRKEPVAVSQWSPGLVESCARLQREILDHAAKMLRKDGLLIYSTCTFNTSENEENSKWLISQGFEPVDLKLSEKYNLPTGLDPDLHALRFMPHLTKGEGLFVTVMRKTGDETFAQPARGKRGNNRSSAKSATAIDPQLTDSLGPGFEPILENDTLFLANPAVKEVFESLKAGRIKVLSAGVRAASLKGKEWKPDSRLALSSYFRRDVKYPYVDLNRDEALSYLRHEAIYLPPDTEKGYVTVGYMGHPLGFVKNIGNRANNLFPAEWRIRFR